MSELTSIVQNSIGNHFHTFEQVLEESTGVALTSEALLTILLDGLPTADPEVAGALWNSDGTLMVSAG